MDYRSSGVDIEAGNQAVNMIKHLVKKTHSSNVIGGLGGFAAGFRCDFNAYEDPILVSCTDGVGTKVKIAAELGVFDTVGIDLVAMSANDLVCMGAKPLFFLDYIACSTLVPSQMEALIAGMTTGCIDADCALIGGEMAEMNDVYAAGEFDLAGFVVGVVDRKKVIDGNQIRPGQHVYGLASSGIHSNGYSLVRKVLPLHRCEALNVDPKVLLEPTRIYVKDILSLIETNVITGIAHNTGGGIVENVSRIVPNTVDIVLQKGSWDIPSIFNVIQEAGQVAESEMYKVFNMGLGMIVVSEDKLEDAAGLFEIGSVQEGSGRVVL